MHSPAARAEAPAGNPSAAAGEPPLPAWVVVAVGAAILLTYVLLLGHYPLGEPDEARYGEIPREMIELGDWVTPHLNYVKYFEKPPLVYWLTAAAFRAFGMSEAVVRLWPAAFGLFGIGMAYALGRSMWNRRVGAAAAAVLATTPLYFGLSQVVTLDMPLAGLMTLALGAFWFAYSGSRHRRAWVVTLYGATALAVLTKGPVAAVLAGGIIVLFLLLQRDAQAVRWLASLPGLAVFLIVALPWFVLVSRRNPEFLDFFIVKQHVQRFLTPDEHRQSLWFFVPIVVGGMLPWTAFALFAPRFIGRFGEQLLRRRASAGALYCGCWAAVVFVFFSLSGSKLATYVLPLFCPLALLAGRFLDELITTRQASPVRRGALAMLVGAGFILLAALVAGEIVDDWHAPIILTRAWLGGLVLAGSGGLAWYLARRLEIQAALISVCLGMLVLQLVAISGRRVAGQYRPLGLAIRAQARPQDLVVAYRHYVQGLTFYGRRRTIMVGSWGELDFGSQQGDQSAFFWKTDADLLRAWASPTHLFLVINRSELDPLLAELHPAPRQIAACGKKVLVVNFPKT